MILVCLELSIEVSARDSENAIKIFPSLLSDKHPQPVLNNLPRIKRYGISNETVVIPGRLRTVITKDDNMTSKEPRIFVKKINVNDNSKRGFKTDADDTEIRKLDQTDLEQYQHRSLKAPGITETYKVSQSIQGRPAFHVVRDDFDFDSDRVFSRREARLNIENDHEEFPSFASQFFGSFGEFSQSSFDVPKSSHNDDHYYDPGTKKYNQRPHLDIKPHHDQPHGGFHSQHQSGHHHQVEKPRPLKPPKREILSSYHEKPLVHDKYSSLKDVSALYVEDPWKHIDKVCFLDFSKTENLICN